MKILKRMKILAPIAMIFALLCLWLIPVGEALALTTADVSVNATPSYISISIAVDNQTYSFGTVATSATPSTGTSYFPVTNLSTVITNQSIKVTSATWTGGTGWTHDDTATAGADTVGLTANKGGAWGVGDVIVKAAAAFNNIAASQAVTTDYSFGLKLYAPTSFSDGTLKTNTVRITATAA